MTATGACGGVADLYDRYADLVFRTCRAILADHHDAEDAAQEVFTKLLARTPDGTVRDERRWLLEVTRNHCFDRRRAAARRPTVPVAGEPVAGDNAEHRSVARAQVRWLLSLLPARQREVVVHQALLDEDLDTVASRLGISYGAAAQLMYRARRVMAQAHEAARGGIGLAGAPLAALRMRVRELGQRVLAGGREIAGRVPLDAALALPAAAMLVAMFGAPPHVGAPPSPSVSQPGALAAARLPRGITVAPAARAAALGTASVQIQAHAGTSGVPGARTKVVVLTGKPIHLPQPPGPQCPAVDGHQVCPITVPSTVVLGSATIRVGPPALP